MIQTVTALPHRRLRPLEPQTFAEEADRARLSSTALVAFRALVQQWRLTSMEAAALLAVSDRTWDRWKQADHDARLNQDQLTRVSGLVGIYKGLHLLFAGDTADAWPKMKNKGPLFQGDTPVDAMIEGGIPRILEVRRHVDALRGGL